MRKIVLFLGAVAVVVFFANCDLQNQTDTYKVTYNGNGSDGGTVPTDSAEYEKDDTVTVAAAGTMTRAGYSFEDWNTASNGGGSTYAAGATFSMGESDVTLYAQWGGTLTVEISGATTFEGHYIYYSIYDSNATSGGVPSGNIIGQAKLLVASGAGSTETAVSSSDSSIKTFDNGTYYLGGMVDLNDNAESMGYAPDSGDKYTTLIAVTVSGDSTHTISESDFAYTY